MFSSPSPDAVLSGLGDKFLLAFSASVTDARRDIEDMRRWRPDWFPTMHSRCLANLIHDRIWAHLVSALDADHAAVIHEYGPTREVQVGRNYLIRVKRHLTGDQISTYPTQTALRFYLQDAQPAFPGLELITLAGYRWDDDLRKINAPVLSYRDGKDNPIWAVELDEPGAGATSIRWTPLAGPELPSVAFGELDGPGDAEIMDEG